MTFTQNFFSGISSLGRDSSSRNDRFRYDNRDPVYDCCRPSQVYEYPEDRAGSSYNRRPREYDLPHPRTHGTYIYPSISTRFGTAYPESCSCTCCPHTGFRQPSSRPSGSSSSRASETKPLRTSRREAYAPEEIPKPQRLPPRRRPSDAMFQQRKFNAAEISVAEQEERARRHDREQRLQEEERLRHERSSSSSKHAKESRSSSQEKSTIEVMDLTGENATPLTKKTRFGIYLTPNSTAESLIAFLNKDTRRYKLYVRWENDDLEALDKHISIQALRREGKQLQLRKRKCVHWS